MAKVVLSDGKEVEISGVLFNKEQNINVGKTYITTVKKAVTKVSEDYYKVEAPKKEEGNSIFETMTEAVAAPKVEEPAPASVVEAVPTPEPAPVAEVVPELPSVEPVLEPELPKVEEPKVESVIPEAPVVAPIPEPVPEVKVEEPVPEPVVSAPVVEPTPVPELPKVEPVLPVASPEPKIEPVVAPIPSPEVLPEPAPAVVPPVAIPPVEPTPEVKTEVPALEPVSTEPKLMFDGSQETNLNQALGEVSDEKTLPTQEEGVASIREFGVDTPAVPEVAVPESEKGKVLTKSKGFANNKFFMVIAIVFFIAACVFLGYEAFTYFQLVK